MARRAHVLDDEDIAFLRRLRREFDSSSLAGTMLLRNRTRFVLPQDFRTGLVTSTITGGSTTVAGEGRVRWDHMNVSDKNFGEEADDTEEVYNYQSSEHAVGTRVICHLDRTAYAKENAAASVSPRNVWVVLGTVSEEPLEGAVWLTGTQNINSTAAAFHAQFQYCIVDNPPYSSVTHKVGDPTKDGFKIESEGRHLIFAQATFTTASPTGSIIINNGDDLCTKIVHHSGEMRLVRNDSPTTPGGTESLASEFWSHDALCNKLYIHKTIITLGWHDVNDNIKLWINALTVSSGTPATHLTAEYRLGAIYLGDFDIPWDA